LFDFYKELHITIIKFPKSDKHTLGQKIQLETLEILELVLSASKTKTELKIQQLSIASTKLDLIKLLLRLAFEIKALDNKRYIVLEKYLQEIGKMLGGWLRSLES